MMTLLRISCLCMHYAYTVVSGFLAVAHSHTALCNHSCDCSSTGTAESHMLIAIGLQCANGLAI